MARDTTPKGLARDGEDDEAKYKPYAPSEEDKALIADVDSKFTQWRSVRQPHESQWFINAAFFRGQQYVYWHERDNRLATPEAPARRVRLPINRLQSKIRARLAKFVKNRPQPVVIPASTDFRARQDARMSSKALEYAWQKLRLEVSYREALQWAAQTNHGLWWFYWDNSKSARMKNLDPMTGKQTVVEIPAGQPGSGDIGVEVDSPFNLLVADPAEANIGLQPEIMRIKLRAVADVKARYDELGVYVKADTTLSGGIERGEQFDRKISQLASSGGGVGASPASEGKATHVVVKEWFERPTPSYPQGRYAVVAGGVLLRYQEELPYGFHDLPNPYPCVDFQDFLQVGQFWGTTILEQLIPIQKEYNLMRSKVAENIRMMAFPKVLAATQHRIPAGAWTNTPGEMIEYVAHPNIPPPTIITPAPIATDVWRATEALRTEFDEVSHIYPETEGRAGSSNSGFQTNLLQEATDQVHAPDIRAHELAVEEAAWKIRRLMKQGYSVPRLLTVAGRDLQPEVFEFSAEDIDENAEVRVQAGSALPMLRGARIQSIMELYNAGLLGDPADPETRRRALSMLELGTIDDSYNYARLDEDQANVENTGMAEGQPINLPDFWENHAIHYRVHTSLLKSAEGDSLDEATRHSLISHVISHVKYQNPQAAIQLAIQYQMPEVVQDLIQQQQQSAQAQMITGGTPGPTAPPPATPNAQRAAQGGGFAAGKPPGAAGPPSSPSAAQSGNNSLATGFGARGPSGATR